MYLYNGIQRTSRNINEAQCLSAWTNSESDCEHYTHTYKYKDIAS